MNAPTAAASLRGLLDQRRIDPAGALVFAALLHLAGNGDGARFWWEFAAGAGDATAAFCLGLLHEGRAEFRTARHWRRQNLALVRGDREGRGPRRRIVRALFRRGAPRILSDDVRHDLIARCHQGDKPALPPAVEAVVHGLGVEGDDCDFGEVPRPDASLISLNHRPARRRWSARGTVQRTWAAFVIRRRARASPTRRLTAVRVWVRPPGPGRGAARIRGGPCRSGSGQVRGPVTPPCGDRTAARRPRPGRGAPGRPLRPAVRRRDGSGRR
ncbi:hypothetical protein ACWD6I_16550 [Streptomyces sp. NPDC002454]